MANWFTSTYPREPLRPHADRSAHDTGEVRYVLRYPTYTEIRDSGILTREISRGELLPLLREVVPDPPAGRHRIRGNRWGDHRRVNP